MSDRVHNWIDEPDLLAMLNTHELDSWRVSEGRVVIGLYRASDRTVTHRSLRDIEVPPRPDLAGILRGGLSERALRELLTGQRPRCAVEQATSSGPMRPCVRCSPKTFASRSTPMRSGNRRSPGTPGSRSNDASTSPHRATAARSRRARHATPAC
jgi:hypothetical protein